MWCFHHRCLCPNWAASSFAFSQSNILHMRFIWSSVNNPCFCAVEHFNAQRSKRGEDLNFSNITACLCKAVRLNKGEFFGFPHFKAVVFLLARIHILLLWIKYGWGFKTWLQAHKQTPCHFSAKSVASFQLVFLSPAVWFSHPSWWTKVLLLIFWLI